MRATCFRETSGLARQLRGMASKHVARIARSYMWPDRMQGPTVRHRASGYDTRQILRRRYAPMPARYTVNIA
jgi:hypothetical protein